jgi:hypothetical protein
MADWLTVPAAAGVAVAVVADAELGALELLAELLLLLLLLPQAASATADRMHTAHAGASRRYSLVITIFSSLKGGKQRRREAR